MCRSWKPRARKNGLLSLRLRASSSGLAVRFELQSVMNSDRHSQLQEHSACFKL